MMPRSMFFLVITLLFALGCSSRQQRTASNKLISPNYLESDSVQVRILYCSFSSCIPGPCGILRIIRQRDKTRVLNYPSKGKATVIGPMNANVISEIANFEKRVKANSSCDAGYRGDKGILVTLQINDEESKFSYCKEYWDGIGILLKRLKAIEELESGD